MHLQKCFYIYTILLLMQKFVEKLVRYYLQET